MTLDFKQLLENFLADTLTPEELPLFLERGKEPENQAVLRRVLAEKLSHKAYHGLSAPGDIDRLFVQMLESAKAEAAAHSNIVPAHKRTYILFARVAAAILLIGGATFLGAHYMHTSPAHAVKQTPAVIASTDVVAPGGNKAVLTLSNGTNILLDSAANGVLAQQGRARVMKLANGQVAYQDQGSNAESEVLYNAMSTPRGGQYKLTLPDGTQVWLNASSSISYPTAFTGKERKVTVKGEAYFEVTDNVQMPFKVELNGVAVDVLGTHFNVNGYGDETSTRITLLEGAVRITKGTASALLKPGQQAQIATDNKIKFTDDVDVEEAVAWKNGLFWFNGVDLPGIMRQLSRWYDIDVQYEGAVPQRHFTGHVFRDLKLSEVLKILELSHVHFKLEGKKLIVTP